jgi:hypothetical protein
MYVYMYIKAEIVYSDKTKVNTFTIIFKDILENLNINKSYKYDIHEYMYMHLYFLINIYIHKST